MAYNSCHGIEHPSPKAAILSTSVTLPNNQGGVMHAQRQAELRQRYPKFFRQPSGLIEDVTSFDERGVECGDGWFELIDRLCSACEQEIETLAAQGVPREQWPRIAQIKEKMGGLRFYVRGPLSEALLTKISTTAYEESLRTCEQCGAPCNVRDSPWRQTQCESYR